MTPPTTTKNGLKVICELDDTLYRKGIVVSDEQLGAINMVRADFTANGTTLSTFQSLRPSS